MARIKSTNVLSFFKEQITLLESSNKLGTARNYRRTLSSFSLFLEGRDIPFRLLDEPLVIRYESWLRSRGVLRNSSSFYMRVLQFPYIIRRLQSGWSSKLSLFKMYIRSG